MSDEAHDEALVRAHDALAFLGAVKMLELSAFEMSIAIGAAEIWASGEHPTDVRVARILSVPDNQYGVVGIVLGCPTRHRLAILRALELAGE